MNESQARHRPPQVTIAALAVICGALLLLASGFDSMGSLSSVDLRERLSEVLASSSARGMGLTLNELIGWIRVATLVSGGAAAAAAVLGWFALQRHRGARIGLAVCAVVLIACAPFVGGGILAAFVAVAIAALWSGPARDWFAGRPVRTGAAPAAHDSGTSDRTEHDSGPAEEDGPAEPPPAPQLPPVSGTTAPDSPPPTHGFGDVRSDAPPLGGAPTRSPVIQDAPPPPDYPMQQPTERQARSVTASRGVDRRPVAVVVACVVTWLFAGFAAALFVVAALGLARDPGRFVGMVRDTPSYQQLALSPNAIHAALWVAVAFYFVWALAACLLAWFAWRQHQWARILLVVSALATALLGLLAVLAGAVQAMPHLIACVVVVGLLLGGNAGRWFARRPHQLVPGPPDGEAPRPPGGRPPRPW